MDIFCAIIDFVCDLSVTGKHLHYLPSRCKNKFSSADCMFFLSVFMYLSQYAYFFFFFFFCVCLNIASHKA